MSKGGDGIKADGAGHRNGASDECRGDQNEDRGEERERVARRQTVKDRLQDT